MQLCASIVVRVKQLIENNQHDYLFNAFYNYAKKELHLQLSYLKELSIKSSELDKTILILLYSEMIINIDQ
jgi:hypothetical protein